MLTRHCNIETRPAVHTVAFSNSLRMTHTNGHNRTHSPLRKNMASGVWSREEHDRFLVAIKQYPQGPWRLIAECIGTRSLRQVQTHAQKYHEKIVRRMRGLRKDRRNAIERGEHRIDAATLEICKVGEGYGVILPGRVQQQQQQAQPSSGADEQQAAGMTAARSFQLIEAGEPAELPTFDESLDFLIEYLSAEVLSDEDLEFDLGDIC